MSDFHDAVRLIRFVLVLCRDAGGAPCVLQRAKLYPADLARNRLRQSRELDALDALVGRKALLAEGEDGLGRGGRRFDAGLEHHEGLGHRKPQGIGAGNDRRLCHRRRSEEHTSELQSLRHLVCRLLLEKKKNTAEDPNTIQKTTTYKQNT